MENLLKTPLYERQKTLNSKNVSFCGWDMPMQYEGIIAEHDATELIHEFLIAINAQLSIDELSKMIFAHPTLSESILDLSFL